MFVCSNSIALRMTCNILPLWCTTVQFITPAVIKFDSKVHMVLVKFSRSESGLKKGWLKGVLTKHKTFNSQKAPFNAKCYVTLKDTCSGCYCLCMRKRAGVSIN